MEVEPLTAANEEEGEEVSLESIFFYLDQCNVCVYIHNNEQQTNKFNKLSKM